MGMVVNGFIEPVTRTLPMEYAVEWSVIDLPMKAGAECPCGRSASSSRATILAGKMREVQPRPRWQHAKCPDNCPKYEPRPRMGVARRTARRPGVGRRGY